MRWECTPEPQLVVVHEMRGSLAARENSTYLRGAATRLGWCPHPMAPHGRSRPGR
jgi:hypothetical protein